MPLDLEIASEVAAAQCDRCHERRGVRFLDHYWLCLFCAMVYSDQLRAESICRSTTK
jgi:hypothetical protein